MNIKANHHKYSSNRRRSKNNPADGDYRNKQIMKIAPLSPFNPGVCRSHPSRRLSIRQIIANNSCPHYLAEKHKQQLVTFPRIKLQVMEDGECLRQL